MSWIGLLLVGIGLADLVHTARPARVVPEATAAVAVVLLGLAAGFTGGRDLVAVLVVAAAVLAWGQSVTWGFGRGHARVPLAVGAGALATAGALAGLAGEAGGLVGRWVGTTPLPLLSDLSADELLLLLGVVLVQLSTGNVLVRLVLDATGTMHPVRDGAPTGPESRLKGGRLLGPMERVLIVGLGVAGHLTAASLVIAAKGLLRFPELSSDRGQERIHRLTEYFLVGSFVSWMLALGGVALLAR